MDRLTRQYFQYIGICPSCRKNDLFGDEKMCVECKAYHSEKNRLYWDRHKEQYREQKRLRSKQRVLERKEQGLCTKCGKRKNTEGFSTCNMCRIKSTNLAKSNRARKVIV